MKNRLITTLIATLMLLAAIPTVRAADSSYIETVCSIESIS